MSRAQKWLLVLIQVLILLLVWILGTTTIPEDLHFAYLKHFGKFIPVFLVLQGLGFYLCTRYENSLLLFLRKAVITESRQLDEVPESHPLHQFYILFLTLLEKMTKPIERPVAVREILVQQMHEVLSRPGQGLRDKVSEFLRLMRITTPNAELFVFGVSRDRIHLIEFTGTEELSRDRLKLMGNWAMTFSSRTGFSGKCMLEGRPMITNELKGDPNLGQFLAENNPNIPIYGAIFPLGTKGDVRGFLWIRDGAQSMDVIEHLREQYMFCSRLLYDCMSLMSAQIPADRVRIEDVYLQFESQSRQLVQAARTQGVHVTILLFYLKVHDPARQIEALEVLVQALLEHFPAMSTATREFNLMNCCIYGLSPDKAMVLTAKILRKLTQFLHFDHAQELILQCPPKAPLGEIFAGSSCIVPVNHTLDNLVDKARDALKQSIADGPYLMRMNQG